MARKKSTPGLGYVPLARAVLRRRDLTPLDKVMLMAISDHAYFSDPRDGICRASNKDLADAIGGRGRTVVIESLGRLEAAGLVSRMMTNGHARMGIEITFDRFGGAEGGPENRTPQEAQGCAENRTPGDRKTGHQVTGKPDTPPIDTLESIKTPSSTGSMLGSDLVTESKPTEAPIAALVEAARVAEGYVPGDPITTINHLLIWLSEAQDDPKIVRSGPTWAALVQQRLGLATEVAVEWVQDAVMRAVDRCDDDSNGGPSAYALACINRWIAQKGRPHVEILQASLRAVEEANKPDLEKADRAKAEAKAAETAKVDAEAKAKARWDRLPVRDRDRIEKAVLEANPFVHTLRNPARMIQSLCIAEMQARSGTA